VTVFRLATGVALTLFLASVISAAPSGGTPTTVVVRPLSTTDLPAGFTSFHPTLQSGLCAGLNLPTTGPDTTVGFQSLALTIQEGLSLSDAVGIAFNELVTQYAACRVVRPVRGLNVHGSGRRLSLPQVGDQSQAFSFSLTLKGDHINEDLVVFRKGLSCGVLEFVSSGPLSLQQVESISSIASSKTGSSSVLSAGSNRASASTLLSDACNATFLASAFRVQGHVMTGGTSGSLDVYFGSAGELINFTQKGDQSVRIIVNGPSSYIEANRTFWQSLTKSSRAASLAAGHWIDMSSDKKDADSITNALSKGGILAGCGAGSTTYAGSTAVNGVKVIKIHQDWSDESDTYYVEIGPTPYILRIAASPSKKNSGDLVFSDYGVQPDTAAPRGAIPISQLH
jgi:hypothetical protein